MRRITFMAALATFAFGASASAQPTCRAADITSDGKVGGPDFIALSSCWGQPVDVPLPQGQYVGYAPSTLSANDGRDPLTRDQECRDNFGPRAHWCTTLEMQGLDMLLLPELATDGTGGLHVRMTPPVQVGAANQDRVDWVTGVGTAGGRADLRMWREGSRVWTVQATNSAPTGPACCMEPTP